MGAALDSLDNEVLSLMRLQDIVGQDKIVSSLRRSLERGRVVHAYLFAGADGLGKRTTAEALAMALLCQAEPMVGCGQCRACQRVLSGNHPDFHRLRTDGTQIGTDAVRELKQQLSLQPYEAGFKVALIEEAERMTAQAANSLLKFLEEPVGEAVIVLTVNNMAQMLSTIISRCQVYRFRLVSTPELAQRLMEVGVPEDKAWKRALQADGIVGRALSDTEEERAWDLDTCGAFCDQLINAGADWLFKQTDGWAYDAAQAEDALQGIQEWFRLILMYKAMGTTELPEGPLRERLHRQAQRFGLAQVEKVQEAVARARHALSLHVNVRLTLDALLLQIHSLAANW